MNREEIDFTDAKMLRSIAEEQLKARQPKEIVPVELADLEILFHELQVREIELEMQNEELRRTYDAAEIAHKKFTILFDLSPMGYFTLNSEGAILELNFKGAEMLRERRFSLLNSNIKLFVSEESRQVFNNFFKKVYTSNAKESCEVLLGYNKNPLCKVYMEGVVTGDDQKCLLSVLDISRFQIHGKS